VDLLIAWAQVLATALVAATLYVGWRQAKAMELQLAITREQVADLQETRSRQQLYEVLASLVDIRADIERVISLDGKALRAWTEEERRSAYTVCAKLHLVGILVVEKLVPERLFSFAWYWGVPACFRILQPYLAELRADRDSRYFSAFDALNRRVLEQTRDFAGWA